MCSTCEAAMEKCPPTSDGATAHAWDRIAAAISAWRATLDDEVEFAGVMEECEAWCKHMEETAAGSLAR